MPPSDLVDNVDRLDSIDFCTLGMFIIDEIEFQSPKPPVKDIVGGAGSYAVVGARMVAGKKYSQAVGWIVDTGSDFPSQIKDIISSWKTHCVFREHTNRLTTRGWNGYGPDEKRSFKYLTPKIRLDSQSLTSELVPSKSFHLICSATRCYEIVHEILERRRGQDFAEQSRPIFVWEPVPDLCRPDELSKFYEVIPHVDVVSPNEAELASYFGNTTWDANEPNDRRIAETITKVGIGPDGNGILVVRAGKDGCCAFSRGERLELPAYDGAHVVDPTGAGNAFLGALAEALVSPGRPPTDIIPGILSKSRSWSKACEDWHDRGRTVSALICATVAASYVIEQVGVPTLSSSDTAEEYWNGTSYIERIRLYTKQLIERHEARLEKKK